MRRDKRRYKSGDWNAICDVCGFKYKASDLKLRWDNLWVCPQDWEQRHPSDFFRAIEDDQSVEWVRPEGEDVFIETTQTGAIAGVAIAGAAISGTGVGTDYNPNSLLVRVWDISKSSISGIAIAGSAVAGDKGSTDLVLSRTIIPQDSFSYEEVLFTSAERDLVANWNRVDIELISTNDNQMEISELYYEEVV